LSIPALLFPRAPLADGVGTIGMREVLGAKIRAHGGIIPDEADSDPVNLAVRNSR
jgi:hypothetical protein